MHRHQRQEEGEEAHAPIWASEWFRQLSYLSQGLQLRYLSQGIQGFLSTVRGLGSWSLPSLLVLASRHGPFPFAPPSQIVIGWLHVSGGTQEEMMVPLILDLRVGDGSFGSVLQNKGPSRCFTPHGATVQGVWGPDPLQKRLNIQN